MLLETMHQMASYTPQCLRIQYVSDLHLEFPQNRQWIAEHPLEVTGDILLVAGDTAYLDLPDSKHETYSQYEFWDWASTKRSVTTCTPTTMVLCISEKSIS